MPYDIELKNGKWIRNVDDDLDPDLVIENFARIQSQKAMKKYRDSGAREYKTTDSMDTYDRFGAGVATGAQRTVRGIGNMVGLVDDQTLRDQDTRDKDLADTTSGRIGQLVGNAAVTAPIGVAGGAALGGIAKGLGTVSNPDNVRRAMMLVKALEAAGEGAISSASMAEAGKQGEAAGSGAMWGGGLNLAGQAGSRLLRGMVRKSPEHLQLLRDVELINAQKGAGVPRRELFVPIAAGASESDLLSRAAGTFYREVLPYAPFAKEKILKQGSDAMQTVGETMLQGAAPKGLNVGVGDDLAGVAGRFSDDFEQGFQGLAGKTGNIGTPKGFAQRIADRIGKLTSDNHDPVGKAMLQDPDVRRFLGDAEELATQFADKNGKIDLFNLHRMKMDLASKYTGPTKHAIEQAMEEIDGVFGKSFRRYHIAGDDAATEALGRYRANRDAYREFLPIAKNMGKGLDDLNFKSIALSARPSAVGPSTEKTAADAYKVFKHLKDVNPAPAGRLAAGAAQLTSIGFLGALPALGIAATTGAVLPSKLLQRGLYGDTAGQKLLVDALRKKGVNELSNVLSRGVRTGLTVEGAE